MSRKIARMMNTYRVLAIANILSCLALIVLVVIGYIQSQTVSIGMMILGAVVVGLFLARFVLAFQMDTLKKQEFKRMFEGVVDDVLKHEGVREVGDENEKDA